MPENTLAAFEYAARLGVDVIELDCVVTKDNELVVHHDLALHGRAVRSMTLEEVLAFDRGATRSEGFPSQAALPGLRIPRLEEVFAFLKAKPQKLMVETKMDPNVDPRWFTEAIDRLIRKYALSERVIFQSFDHRTLHVMKDLNPAVELALLNPARRLDDYVGPARALGPKALQVVNVRVVDAQIVQTLHAAAIRVFSGTANDPADWKRLREAGVDAIVTDDPAALRALLK